MVELLLKQPELIYCEMMSHPALFTHPKPRHVAIMGDSDEAILQEVVKHTDILQIWHLVENKTKASLTDKRVTVIPYQPGPWPMTTPLDVIIIDANATPTLLLAAFNALNDQGILVQQTTSPFDFGQWQPQQTELKNLHFAEIQSLHFPQPNFATGWRMLLMAKKQGTFKHLSEKAIFNRSFTTHYYNYDVHKAALALPEFMRAALQTT